MYLLSTFEQNEYLELAISSLEQQGIPKEYILAVPLDMNRKKQVLGDSIHSSDGTSFAEITFLVSTFFGALGSIIGFRLPWGPIAMGLAGFVIGGVVGFVINYVIVRSARKRGTATRRKIGEVILSIYCITNTEAKFVEDTLWEHFALGVAKLDSPRSGQTR